MEKRRTDEAKQTSDPWGPADYVFSVPVAAAAEITGFRHDRAPAASPRKEDAYREVTTLEPINGNALRRLSKPPKWWQTVGSIEYYNEGEERREPRVEELKQFKKEFMDALMRAKRVEKP